MRGELFSARLHFTINNKLAASGNRGSQMHAKSVKGTAHLWLAYSLAALFVVLQSPHVNRSRQGSKDRSTYLRGMH
jgi:hypothetical protein